MNFRGSFSLKESSQSLRVDQLFEGSLQFFPAFTHRMIFSIVPVRVLPNQTNLSNKLFRSAVTVMAEFFANCP